MIVITNPISISNEIKIIHSLFEEGLSFLHVRKPDFSETEMESFLLEIGLEYRNRLVLHSHHHLAKKMNINQLHFSEKERNLMSGKFLNPIKCHSTSVHNIDDFNALKHNFEYVFLSPIFPSISKPNYTPKINHFKTLKHRTNFDTKLVALGGISAENIQQTLENGFDNVALLGTLWNSNNPLENFKKCQQIAHSF